MIARSITIGLNEKYIFTDNVVNNIYSFFERLLLPLNIIYKFFNSPPLINIDSSQ